MIGLLHAMAFMVLLLVGWVIWNNEPLPLHKSLQTQKRRWKANNIWRDIYWWRSELFVQV